MSRNSHADCASAVSPVCQARRRPFELSGAALVILEFAFKFQGTGVKIAPRQAGLFLDRLGRVLDAKRLQLRHDHPIELFAFRFRGLKGRADNHNDFALGRAFFFIGLGQVA